MLTGRSAILYLRRHSLIQRAGQAVAAAANTNGVRMAPTCHRGYVSAIGDFLDFTRWLVTLFLSCLERVQRRRHALPANRSSAAYSFVVAKVGWVFGNPQPKLVVQKR